MGCRARGRCARRPGAPRVLAGLAAVALVAGSACTPDSGAEGKGLEAARAALEQGEVQAAIERLRGLAAERPSAPAPAYWLGVALRRAGRPSEALFPLGKAARSEAYAVRAGVLQATTLAEIGSFEAAIEAADRVLAREPGSRAALLARARAALSLERGELALDSAERLAELEEMQGLARPLRAAALAQMGRVDDAERAFRELMEQPAEADRLSAARACVALAELQLGELLELRSPSEAQQPLSAEEREARERGTATLAECEERFGDRPGAVRAVAEVHARLGDDEEATAVLRRGVEASPGDAGLWRALGARLVAQDRFEEAEGLILARIEERESAEDWLSLASVRQLAGDAEGALSAVEGALALQEPPAQSALFRRADLLVTLGRLEEAEATLAELAQPLYRRAVEGRLAQARGEPARALELYESVIGEWPHHHALRVKAALAALELGDTERAKQQLLEAYRTAPERTDAALWLGRIHFAEGDYAEAASFAGRHLRARGTAAPDAHVLAARSHVRSGRRARAHELLAQLAEARDGRFAGVALAERARLEAEAQGAERALAGLEAAVERRGLDLAAPAGEPALRQLVGLWVRSGRGDEAEARLAALLEAHPERPALHALAGRLALLRGAPEEAERAFERALELAPEHPAALAGRGLLARQRGELARAAEWLEAAWEAGRDPHHGYRAGRTRLDAGDAEAARERFEEVLRLHPEHAATANDLAWLLAERGEALPRAQALAEQALRLAPGPEVRDTLGYVLLKRGRAEEAVRTFREVLERRPEDATARYHLALALRAAGRRGAAREALERALERPFPEAERARELLARLEE